MALALSARAARWQRLPVAVRVALIYLCARIVTTGFFVAAAALSGPSSRFGAGATIGDLAVGWDATWYWYVAVNGYPTTLPLTDGGLVAENQWAFMPLYAYLSQALGWILGGWGAGAVVISLGAGYLSALVLFRMLHPRLGGSAATWAVVFFSAGPLAALFQIGYAESLFLLFLLLALWCLQRRRYGWLYLLIPLMGATRPGILPFALTLGLFGIWRLVRRSREPLPVREVVNIVALGALAIVVGFAWQVIAGLVTGDAGAYLATELAWRRNWIPDAGGAFVPFDGFVLGVQFWFTAWGAAPWVGYVCLGLVVAAVAAVLIFEPHVRRLGIEVRLWSASYLLYLLAVFFPQSSIFRLLFPLSPLWGAVAIPRHPAWRIGVLALCVLGQWWWIYNMYALANTYWQIP